MGVRKELEIFIILFIQSLYHTCKIMCYFFKVCCYKNTLIRSKIAVKKA